VKKILFISSGPIEWGSSRLRCFWVAEQMKESGVIISGNGVDIPSGFDAYVFQKIFDYPAARAIVDAGALVFWDLCDPLHWFSPQAARDALSVVHAVTTSSENLTEDFIMWADKQGFIPQTYTIPDRMNMKHYTKQRKHGEANPVRFIWFGLGVNRPSLFGTLACLSRLKANGYPVELTIYDDMPGRTFADDIPVYQLGWNLNTEVDVISAHDIALLPPYPGAWGEVKSNNKKLTALACGLPYVDGFHYDQLENLVKSADARKALHRVQKKHFEQEKYFDISASARDWQEVIADVQQ
jgi:hypothetical protein